MQRKLYIELVIFLIKMALLQKLLAAGALWVSCGENTSQSPPHQYDAAVYTTDAATDASKLYHSLPADTYPDLSLALSDLGLRDLSSIPADGNLSVDESGYIIPDAAPIIEAVADAAPRTEVPDAGVRTDLGPDAPPPAPLDLPCALPDIPLALPEGDDPEGLFLPSSLPVFEIIISDDEWRTFCENAMAMASSSSVGSLYARARLTISGSELRDDSGLPYDVGIRARGRSSLSGIFGGESLEACLARDFSRKASFKISTNKYIAGAEFHGVRKFNLVGHESGDSLVKEFYHAAIAAEMELPAQRVNHALLCINGNYMGIYSLQEEADVQQFLDAHFTDPTGNYYKVETGGGMHFPYDYTEFYSSRYKPVAGTPEDMAALMDFLRFVNLPSDNPAFESEVEDRVNISQWLQAVALEMVLLDWDGAYPRRSNYLIYQDPSWGWSMIRFDTDGIFNSDPDDWDDIADGSRILCYNNGGYNNNDDGTIPHIGPGSEYTIVSNPQHPILPARLLYLYRADYLEHVATVASLVSSRVDDLLDERVSFMATWIGSADAPSGAVVDPYERPYGSEGHALRVETLKAKIREQSVFVEAELARDLLEYTCPP